MADRVKKFYDELASNYHLIFEDWEASIKRQSAVLGPILERELLATTLRILDCACGIGTQTLGLAERRHRITACDLSSTAVRRARLEALQRGLDVRGLVADLLDLTVLPETDFDVVVCVDNALPHLDSKKQLLQAASQIRGKLRNGGLFLGSIRDYDALVRERPVVQGPAFYSDEGRRRIVHQVWDWHDELRYAFHLYITRETRDGWECQHHASNCRALLRDELTSVLDSAGFVDIRWLHPAESGFYQPIVLAKTPGGRPRAGQQ